MRFEPFTILAFVGGVISLLSIIVMIFIRCRMYAEKRKYNKGHRYRDEFELRVEEFRTYTSIATLFLLFGFFVMAAGFVETLMSY